MQTFGGATPLMYACQQSRDHQVLDLLTKLPYAVKDRDRTLKTPLHYCAENPNTNCAEIVLKFAPELVNAQDENGYCTLHLAVIAGNKSLIKLLIAKGADVNIYDNEGHSAVHWAIVSSEKEALEIIIRAGANPSTPDIHGGYPLHYAVQMCGSNSDYIRNYEDSVRVVETLLNFGVDVNVKDKDGRQPILWAASAGSADAVIHLVSGGACVEAADKDGLTALHCAASRGHTTTIDTLITLCGTNVDVIDGNGCSALFYAVTLGHADATEVLLRLGAEPNRQDRRGRTPAHCGAAKGQLETLRILQKHGGNLWLRNVKGDIPLHEAVASGRKDLVLWLLSQNPEAVNIANNDGRCPLHIAAMYNNTEMVKILLDAKSLVNPVMKTSKGVLMTPLNVALCKGHRSCGKYLQLHGGVPFSKVAKIEPASAFAFRVSPTPEIMNHSPTRETNVDSLSLTRIKVSRSNTSTDVQIVKTETTDKKKVYRRRKKKKANKDVQESDSDENTQKTKTSRKTGQGGNDEDEEVDDESDEDEKTKKVQISNGKIEKNTKVKTNTVNVRSTRNQQINNKPVEETVAVKKVSKSRVEPKPLPRNKSIKENKNVNNLSPDDFPPMMQTVNQLDAVIIEPEIDINKSANEYDTECGLKTPNPPSAEWSGNEQTTEVFEQRKTVKIEIQQNEETNKEMEEVQNVRESENDKAQLRKDEKSDKVKKPKDVKKEDKTIRAPGTKGSTDEGQKNEKPIKSSTFRSSGDEGKKDDKTTKQGSQKNGNLNGNDKPKKSTTSKGSKSTPTTPVSDKDDKKSEKEMVLEKEEITEFPPNEEVSKVGTKAQETSIANDEKPEPEINNSDESKTQEERIPEVVHEDTKSEKVVEETPEMKNVKTPKIDEGKGSESLTTSDPLKEEDKNDTVSESVSLKQVENVKSEPLQTEEVKQQTSEDQTLEQHIPPKEQLVESKKSVDEFLEAVESQPTDQPQQIEKNQEYQPKQTETDKQPKQQQVQEDENVQSQQTQELEPLEPKKTEESKVPESQIVEENVLIEKEYSKDDVSSEEPKTVEVEQTNAPAETTEVANVLEDVLKVDAKIAEPVQDNPHLESAVTSKHENVPIEEDKPPQVVAEESVKTNSDQTENHLINGNSPMEAKKVNGSSKYEAINNSDRGNNNEGNSPEENSVSEKESIANAGDQRQHKPVRVSRLCRRYKDFKDDMSQASVTQLVQSTIRKYHMERGIFYQLLELKRYQIRSGKANEQVLVKRLADEYERSRVFLGMKPYTGLYKFREFERFLYDQLKALNSRRSLIIPEIKSYDDIDALSGFLKKSRYKIISEIPQPEMVCTCITQRCHHSACAYTSVPCSAYIADLRHHKHHKKRKECFFPRIDQPQVHKPDNQKYAAQPATLELVQGGEKHVITLPQNYPDKTKRYYVTFTIKGVTSPKEDAIDSKDYFKHRHAKSV